MLTTKLFGLKFSNPKETSWIVGIFFLALSPLLPSRLLVLVIYLLRQALQRTKLRRSTWICAGTIWRMGRA
jgi:hypothetical protein